ncbi:MULTISPECIES: NAD-dependent epimerase/dehydratase family protein [unclassified Bradyrhizobium]|uniref:NAD-dependent epimerase/dehydratase family protein n=1 Tax=unclassified Bradyrhizobium TaxID=2631580 RepID=UPI002112270F|nr:MULTISPECIES: NAD-dependent epimerase/dehydratase family protein [unclassified Bradyrhizobium]MCK1307298.1 NAD-dependent epimerase/dehydratase family protein [Bradyrhizobium sp. 45]MCK1435061.1 NAD-dependent epimerase/dehydratase family protein [Bradyrhizobium sp. 15]MCK1613538.1 NAD-dependent epimerase/dehydratase family protein [Bradyrhizobium sp. 163]MCK1763127.1 NAD-dependent epimerase/dehydratase family protein [Bradyrhizobium sp. 136]
MLARTRRILVTGGAGFLGSHLCERLVSAGDGRVISNFIVQALTNQPITIYGDGQQTRSFCYVDDLIDGLVRLMNTCDDVVGPMNLGNPAEITMLELAGMIVDLTGSRSAIEFKPLPIDDPKQRRPNISLAQDSLGWLPSFSLRDGLRKTIAYFESLMIARGAEAAR